VADILESGTNKAEWLAFIPLFYLIDTFNGFFIHNVAPDTIIGIGWIDDDTTLFKDLHDFLDESRLGVLSVNIDQHR
jgi:hypothetical protein